MATLTEHKETIATEQPKEHDVQHEHEKRTHRYLVVAVLVLAAALIGLVAWMVYDNSTTSETATTDEIDQLMDDYTAAWNSYDGDAFLALATEVFTTRMPDGTVLDAEAQASSIASSSSIGWHVDTVGDRMMSGDGPW